MLRVGPTRARVCKGSGTVEAPGTRHLPGRTSSIAARPVAPPPSTTAFSISTSRSMLSAMYFSCTATTLSTYFSHSANALVPT